MISREEVISYAVKAAHGRKYLDLENDIKVLFSSRESVLSAGVKDYPNLKDKWIVYFKRRKMGDFLDGVHEDQSVWVDAETGQTQVIDSF